MAKKKKTPVLETAAEAAPERETRALLTLDSGAVYEVVSSDGKYFYCGPVRFRRANPHIQSVKEVKSDGEHEP